MNRFEFNKRITTVFCLFLLFVPFLNGLVQKMHFYIASIFLILALTYIVYKNSTIYFNRIFMVLFFLQIIVNSVALYFSVNREQAIDGFLRNLIPPLVYLLVLNIHGFIDEKNESKTSINQESSVEILIIKATWAIFISGTLVSMANFILTNGGYGGGSRIIRFGSVILYANTLALFLFICSISGLMLLYKGCSKSWLEIFVKAGITLNIAAMILTLSRFMWILAVFLYVIMLICIRDKKIALKYGILICLALICSAVVSYLKFSKNLLVIIVLLLIIALSQNLVEKLRCMFNKLWVKPFFRPVLYGISAVIAMAATVVVIHLSKSSQLYTRISSISLSASELQERFAYYLDALKIATDYPLTGVGAGGWTSMQYYYQTALYATRYVHSSVMQILVDTGVAGMIIFLVQILLIFVIGYKAYSLFKHKKIHRMYIICIFISNLSIIIHSVLDFDFEFPLINIVFWLNIALLSLFSGDIASFSFKSRLARVTGLFTVYTIVLLQIFLIISNVFYLQGLNSFRNKNYNNALEYFKISYTINPFSSDAYYMNGEIAKELYGENQEGDIALFGLNCLDIAQSLDPFNPRYPACKSYISRLIGDHEKSVSEYRSLITLQPLIIDYYEGLAAALVDKAEKDLSLGRNLEAENTFKSVIAIEHEIERASEKISLHAYRLKHKPEMKVSPRLALYISKSYYFMNEFDKGEQYLKNAESDSSIVPAVNELKKQFKEINK